MSLGARLKKQNPARATAAAPPNPVSAKATEANPASATPAPELPKEKRANLKLVTADPAAASKPKARRTERVTQPRDTKYQELKFRVHHRLFDVLDLSHADEGIGVAFIDLLGLSDVLFSSVGVSLHGI